MSEEKKICKHPHCDKDLSKDNDYGGYCTDHAWEYVKARNAIREVVENKN